MIKHFLTVDLGASGTKVFLSCIKDSKIELKEVGRFESFWYEKQGLSFWNVDRILSEIKEIIKKMEKKYVIQSIGFDGWGVDFVALDESNQKIMDPMRYFSMFKEQEKIKEEIIKHRTFINEYVPGQYQPFNTVYQLIYQKKHNPYLFERIKKIVPIPCYLAGKLCGNYEYEFTHATTTQLYDYENERWSREICERLGIKDILPEVVKSGTIIGKTGSGINCILPATHDTASAYASIPSQLENTLIISAGTWCLNGIVIDKKELKKDFILKNNFAVEGCYNGSLRLLSNTPGLIFWQKIKAELEKTEKRRVDYSDLLVLSEKHKSFNDIVDVDDEKYILSESIICDLKKDLKTEELGKILCGVLNSLANRIKKTKTMIENELKLPIKKVHMIGGGIQNTLLCKKISEYLKIPVYTGPVEGTAFGNTIVQMLSENIIKNEVEKKNLLGNSITVKRY